MAGPRKARDRAALSRDGAETDVGSHGVRRSRTQGDAERQTTEGDTGRGDVVFMARGSSRVRQVTLPLQINQDRVELLRFYSYTIGDSRPSKGEIRPQSEGRDFLPNLWNTTREPSGGARKLESIVAAKIYEGATVVGEDVWKTRAKSVGEVAEGLAEAVGARGVSSERKCVIVTVGYVVGIREGGRLVAGLVEAKFDGGARASALRRNKRGKGEAFEDGRARSSNWGRSHSKRRGRDGRRAGRGPQEGRAASSVGEPEVVDTFVLVLVGNVGGVSGHPGAADDGDHRTGLLPVGTRAIMHGNAVRVDVVAGEGGSGRINANGTGVGLADGRVHLRPHSSATPAVAAHPKGKAFARLYTTAVSHVFCAGKSAQVVHSRAKSDPIARRLRKDRVLRQYDYRDHQYAHLN